MLQTGVVHTLALPAPSRACHKRFIVVAEIHLLLVYLGLLSQYLELVETYPPMVAIVKGFLIARADTNILLGSSPNRVGRLPYAG